MTDLESKVASEMLADDALDIGYTACKWLRAIARKDPDRAAWWARVLESKPRLRPNYRYLKAELARQVALAEAQIALANAKAALANARAMVGAGV